MRTVAAIDLGATSGRVIVGGVDADGLHLRHVARFPNTPVRLPDGLHWDVLALHSAAMHGLGTAARADGELVGAAVDSWAVDYGLVRQGRLLGNPVHYRDERTATGVEAVQARISAADLYTRNGLQHLPFNTVFQLAAERSAGLLDLADQALLIPDLIGFWATGRAVAERTNASTTGLLGLGRDADWDRALMARLDLPTGVLPPLLAPGEILAPVTRAARDEFGIPRDLLFTTVGSHDTASAVVGVPLRGDDGAYISCGTWSLVGVELPSPVATEEARVSGFTNEGGVDGTTRFLKNVMGLWLLSESMRTWAKQGDPEELETLLRRAAEVPGPVPRFDADDARLLAPGDMPARIAALLTETGHPVPASRPELVRCILESLAAAYARSVEDLERVTGRTIRTVHLTGGGAQNELLCRLTAQETGRTVVAGPVEATAVGNLLVQARTHGLVSGGLDALRDVVARSFPPRIFAPASPAG